MPIEHNFDFTTVKTKFCANVSNVTFFFFFFFFSNENYTFIHVHVFLYLGVLFSSSEFRVKKSEFGVTKVSFEFKRK